VLAHAPYFRGLAPEPVAAVERRMGVKGYGEGEIIYRSGAPADGLFILAAGKVKVLRPSLEGAEVLIDVVAAGAMFGSIAALGHTTYPDTAQALTVSCVLRISAAEFRDLLEEHPEIALAVLDDLALRLEHAQQSVRRLAGGTVEQRVASTLLALADKVGEPRGDTVILQLPLTRSDLAAMTGTTTESTSRTLSKLRRQGIIETGRRWTAVVDREALAALASS
jgi:CRP-like cAMP-binding protein